MESYNQTPTLCWTCKHAVPKFDYRTGEYVTGCDWSIYRQKVPGWTAEEGTVPFHQGKVLPSFTVIKCSKYERG